MHFVFKFPSGFLCSAFVEGETKVVFCFTNVFCIRCISKMKRKLAKKNTQTEMFSYQFEAPIPKIRQI